MMRKLLVATLALLFTLGSCTKATWFAVFNDSGADLQIAYRADPEMLGFKPGICVLDNWHVPVVVGREQLKKWRWREAATPIPLDRNSCSVEFVIPPGQVAVIAVLTGYGFASEYPRHFPTHLNLSGAAGKLVLEGPLVHLAFAKFSDGGRLLTYGKPAA